MARKPSERTNRSKPPTELDLTPFIDMITSLMFFLLIFAALIPVVIIDAPLPKIAATADEVRKAKEQKDDWDVTVWINNAGFRVKAGNATKSFAKRGEEYPVEALHAYLVQVHSRRPKSKELTMIPGDDVTYNVMIQTMDAARNLVDGDPGYKPVPPEISAKPESLQFNRLFPDVTIGGV